MREILFRGKRLDNGEWVLSGNIIRFIPENGEDLIFIPALSEPCTCYHDEKDNIIAFEKGIFYKVDTKTVGQYTGLKDKNGKRIFEGDIVEGHCHSAWSHRLQRCDIAYGRNGFEARNHIDGLDSDYYTYRVLFFKDVVIIGNIHDNPELLEK